MKIPQLERRTWGAIVFFICGMIFCGWMMATAPDFQQEFKDRCRDQHHGTFVRESIDWNDTVYICLSEDSRILEID